MTKSLKYISFLFFLIYAQVAYAQSAILFSENGLKKALERAKTENRPLLLWCYTTWCPHCKTMKATVFTNRAVADYFNKAFICIAQDMEKGEGIELNKEIKITSFPTFIFYNPTGETIYRIEGELKSDAFIQEGKNALTPKKQLPYLKQQFEKDTSNSNNCYEYIRALKKGGMDVSTIVKQYFATQSDKQLLSEINWRIISNGVSDISSREMQFVISHQKEFSAIASPLRIKRKLDYTVKELLNPLVENIDTANYLLNRKLAAQIHLYSTDSLIFNYDLRIWELAKNWNAYAKTSLQSTETFAWNSHTQLNDIASNILHNISETRILLFAERMAQKSLTLDEEYDTYLLSSRLYQKTGDIPDALKMAKKANDLSIRFGWEGKEAETLLKELNSLSY